MKRRLSIAVVSALCVRCLFAGEATNKNHIDPVMIYEVCVKPAHVAGSRWVKLRSFSTNDVNLRGYSLHDSTNCFYRFDQDECLRPGGSLVLYFDPVGGKAVTYRDSRGTYRIEVANSSPFSGAIDAISMCRAIAKAPDVQKTDDEFARNWLGWLSFEQYDYLDRLVGEFRSRTGTVKPSKVVIMTFLKGYGYLQRDEVALVNDAGRVVSYVGWKPCFMDGCASSKWEKAAVDAGLVWGRKMISGVKPSDTIFSFPHITLERAGPDSRDFRRMPFGTPDDAQCRDPIKSIDFTMCDNAPLVTVGVGVKSSCDPWTLVLEFAERPDFETILCRKSVVRHGGMWSIPEYPTEMNVRFEPDEVGTLCKHDTWFYRARREFNDGTFGAWTDGVKMNLRDAWMPTIGDTTKTNTVTGGETSGQ